MSFFVFKQAIGHRSVLVSQEQSARVQVISCQGDRGCELQAQYSHSWFHKTVWAQIVH